MNRLYIILFLLSMIGLFSFQNSEIEPSILDVPDNWPKPVYDLSSISQEGFELGRQLFYDGNLSRDGSVSCSSCHSQFNGFTHVDHNVSHGIEDRKGTRNSPVLINLAWNSSFHWDGGVNHLEMQPLNPIAHVAEMDNTLENVLNYLNESNQYRIAFFEVFGDSVINSKMFLKALAQYNASLISSNSKYDQYLKGEVKLTKQEKKGLKLFNKHCNKCHTAPLFNSNIYASNGLPIDSTFNDVGRYKITEVNSDSMKFRVPTLRNIAYTFPYMHDGRFKKLKDVLHHYVNGIDYQNSHLNSELKKPIKLDGNQQKDIIAFLLTLSDKEFLFNQKFGLPR